MISLKTNAWELKDIDTVFFDKDGTFIDSHVYWGEIVQRRVKAAISEFQLPAEDFSDLCLSLGYDLKTKKLLEKGPVGICSRQEVISTFTETLKKYRSCITDQVVDDLFVRVHQTFQPEMNDYVRLLEGAESLFKKLKDQHVKLAVITSDARGTTEDTIKKFGLEKYFDLVVTKEDTPEAKKTGRPALLALRQLGSRPEHAIAIGDAPMDAEMAKNANLKAAVLVATGQIGQESLKKSSEFVTLCLKGVNVLL